MNDKDEEAFEKWCKNYFGEDATIINVPSYFIHTWQAACEYKQKGYSNIMDAMTQTSQYNYKLQAENKKLREALNRISEIGYYHDYGIHRDIAIEALKEITTN